MPITYPWSRISTRNCPTCRLHAGQLKAAGPVDLGGGLEMLRLTCDYCGYTIWFDLAVPRNVPCEGPDIELLEFGDPPS